MNTELDWMLLAFVVANFALAGVGARLGERGPGTEVWYASLRKPPGYPPEWIFAQGWSLVGICSGVAGWLIWRHWEAGAPPFALTFYGLLLICNAVWQGTVMGLRRLGLGTAVGALLWLLVTLTGAFAAPATLAWLWLLPYWVWVGYGTRLNYQLWRYNPAVSLPAGERVS